MTDFTFTINELNVTRERFIAQLRKSPNPADLLHRKLEIDAAIAVLQLCSAHGIHGQANVTVLPITKTATPASEYRIVEDQESDSPNNWVEVIVDNEPVRPIPGTLLLEI